MKIAIGNDHRGYIMKLDLMGYMKSHGHDVVDIGFHDAVLSDHPVSAFKVGEAVAKHQCDRGVLICGSGVGMVVAANKVKGIAAFSPMSEFQTRMSREHNDTNVIVFAADFIGSGLARAILKIWLETGIDNDERYVRRRKMIADYENKKIQIDFK